MDFDPIGSAANIQPGVVVFIVILAFVILLIIDTDSDSCTSDASFSSGDTAGQTEEIRKIRELLEERTKAVESYIHAKRLGAELEELPEQLTHDAIKRKLRKGLR